MGLFGTMIAFAGGYIAGMRIGDRPILAARGAVNEARGRASDLVAAAEGVRTRVMEKAPPALDIREVREVMTPAPRTVLPAATLDEAASLMKVEDIGDVLVADGSGQLQGILTDRDIAIRAVAEGRDPSTTRVSDIMSPVVTTIGPSASVQEALDLMRLHDVRRIPIEENETPVGIVSLGDLSSSRGARATLADISRSPAGS